jgi:hypothetical protein
MRAREKREKREKREEREEREERREELFSSRPEKVELLFELG